MRTEVALSLMALHFTFMVTAVESSSTYLSTRERRFTAIYDIVAFSTIAIGHFLFFARLACSRVTISLTFMFMTVQYTLTLLTTLKNKSLFTAFNWTFCLTTLTFDEGTLVFTRRTFSWMATFRAGMRTVRSSFFITNLPT